tara:strand:+ start:5425 stop:5649 length:225 start_codon:yes stop_codon:yes gene_type:complete
MRKDNSSKKSRTGVEWKRHLTPEAKRRVNKSNRERARRIVDRVCDTGGIGMGEAERQSFVEKIFPPADDLPAIR